MKNFLLVSTLVFLTFSIISAAQMRCDTELIKSGDLKSQVLHTCGKPYRIANEVIGNEKWIYNFGPNNFIKIITFRGERVEEIIDGGYGFPRTNEQLE